ncbi:MAG: ion transporter [Pseudomonadales bacterium]
MSEYTFHAKLRAKLNLVIFGTDTPAGRTFDLALIYAITISVVLVMLDSVEAISAQHSQFFYYAEWGFTILFTFEYLTRLYCSPRPWHYARSFFGLVDLLSILPTYLAFAYGDASYLIIIRLFRVLRIFRILKLMRYLSEANVLMRSMLLARRKILVFFMSVLVLTSVFGSLMFIIEGPDHGFTSIPRSIYWAIVTITTVGYGDVVPQTWLGQTLASLTMVIGYAIIAVPTGIITAELSMELQRTKNLLSCPGCSRGGHDTDASNCKFCGHELPQE